jgi:hypothetical protein
MNKKPRLMNRHIGFGSLESDLLLSVIYFLPDFSFFYIKKLLSISICFFPSFSFCSSFICVLIIRQIDPATEQDQFNTLSSHGPCMALPCIYAKERGTWRIRREWFFFFFLILKIEVKSFSHYKKDQNVKGISTQTGCV